MRLILILPIAYLLSTLMPTPTVEGQPAGLPTLKETFKSDFIIGAELGNTELTGEDPSPRELTASQFNSISPGNLLKWGPFNPRPGEFNHGPADAYVEFGTSHHMYVVGHVLFWHNQTPDWVFEDESGKQVSRDQLLDRMRERVRHVAQRYGNRINAWDVVNESIMDNGKLRDSPWTRIIGDDYIEQAFRIANEELPPDVELIYNDYSMTGRLKREAVVKMIQDLKQKGLRIDGVGMQGHWALGGPSIESIEESILAYSAAGVEVHITELDIDVLPRKAGMWGADIRKKLEQDPAMDPYQAGLPEAVQKQLAQRYADIFTCFLKHHDKIKRVTFWGVSDRYSWLNNWPIKGRTNHPLLLDRQGQPKPAFYAVIDASKRYHLQNTAQDPDSQ
ncbi:MAG: 1,4-beta-xylanase [Phycisphaera sp.]|nr:1,4-beta-xylanase [Phycisphaera sp.]